MLEYRGYLLGIVILTMAGSLLAQQNSSGVVHWRGTATASGQSIPVALDLSAPGKDGVVQGAFVNGQEHSPSSAGSEVKGHLVLTFSDYARKLEGEITSTGFHGALSGSRMKAPVAVELQPDRDGKVPTRFVAASTTGAQGATINGDWEIAVKSPKGESAWLLRVSPFGGSGEIKAVILRIDGDTGGMYGGFDARTGAYRVSRFGPFGRELLDLEPRPDGTLLVRNLLGDEAPWTARRQNVARAEKLPPPTRATEQTTVVDPGKPFQFSAPNLAGITVANTDAQFRDKVVIVAIGGSWCPNCHDEAPFLVDLYKRFHSQGLEIVNLSFEEQDQLKDPQRLRAFITRYGIPYTVLVAGTPDDLHAVVPQGKNLNSWPTSFFIGRDGLVKETHAGFSGPATGQSYLELKAEVTGLVERLLAQRNVAER